MLAVPALFYFLGAASNQAVLYANHDTFPVLVNEYKAKTADTIKLPDGTVMLDPTHCVMTKDTRLNYLADIIDLRTEGIYSVGDGAIMLGEWMFTFTPYLWAYALLTKKRTQNEYYGYRD